MTSILATDVGDRSCWWQVLDNRFCNRKSHQHNRKKDTNMKILLPSSWNCRHHKVKHHFHLMINGPWIMVSSKKGWVVCVYFPRNNDLKISLEWCWWDAHEKVKYAVFIKWPPFLINCKNEISAFSTNTDLGHVSASRFLSFSRMSVSVLLWFANH